MNYRFMELTNVYAEFRRQFLADNPGWERLNYQDFCDRIIKSRGVPVPDVTCMEALGNRACGVYFAVEPLQKAWARENGVKYDEATWLKDIVLAQVKAFEPDVLFLVHLNLLGRSFRRQLREACGKRALMVGWRYAPTPDFGVFRDLDLVLTGASNFADSFREAGVKAEVVPLAFEPDVLREVTPSEQRELDFTFLGGVGDRGGKHSHRYAMIEKLLPETPLQVWGMVQESRPKAWTIRRMLKKAVYQANRILRSTGVSKENRARMPLIRRGASWERDPTLPSMEQRYPDRFHAPVFGLRNYSVSAASKIGFNSHIDCAGDHAGNRRLFETTGMGACLVTDWKVNLSDLFKLDEEVVAYRSAEECIEKVRYLLDHEREREAIAAAGQRRTLRDHTQANRAAGMHEIIVRALDK